MISEYTTKARLFPTVLAAPPILFLCNYTFNVTADSWFESGAMALLFGKGTAYVALVFLMMQMNRLVGLEVQRRLSRDELDFPTTRWLLPDNVEMSAAQRAAVNQKIQSDFQVCLMSATMGDTPEVRRHNADIVGRIRTFVGSPPKLLQFNIEYGFFRNLIGASPFVLLAGVANSYMYSESLIATWAYYISLSYSIFAALLILLAKPIVNRLGVQYARVLFQSYLSKK